MSISVASAQKKMTSFIKKRRRLLINLSIYGAIIYLLCFFPMTKITWERLIDLLSNRKPPAWMMQTEGSVDVHQTKLFKYQKLVLFQAKVAKSRQDLLALVGIASTPPVKQGHSPWFQLKEDLASAGQTFVDFWGVSIITYKDQTIVIGEGSTPINLNDRVLRWQKEIESAATKYKLEPALIAAVIEQESGGDQEAASPKGAIGLMQLMPGTAQQLGVNPYDAAQNIDGGAHYLEMQLNAFGTVEGALAAYNAGPGRVANRTWVTIPETMEYVQRVPQLMAKYERLWNEHNTVQFQPQKSNGKQP